MISVVSEDWLGIESEDLFQAGLAQWRCPLGHLGGFSKETAEKTRNVSLIWRELRFVGTKQQELALQGHVSRLLPTLFLFSSSTPRPSTPVL